MKMANNETFVKAVMDNLLSQVKALASGNTSTVL